MKIIKVFFLFFVLSPFIAQAQHKGLFQSELFVLKNDTLPLRVLYPKGFDQNKKYPLVIFLHGRGESGNDNQKQLTHGAKLFLDSVNRTKFPAIVVFPQCPSDSYWANVKIETDSKGKRHFFFRKGGKPTEAMSLLLGYFKQVEKKSYVDKDRIYVAGLSMGGMGTFEFLRRKSNKVAAAFAICGGDNVANVKKYANKVKLWIFHGEQDDIVSPQFSKDIITELQRLGAKPRYTFYPQANHNSWDPAFTEKDLLPWLFSQRRK
ncbi:prolyl oligopeptidase family serine peptidase [Pseudopedobacter sp.]|uniref:carboxylesterase family protein n=1 Tax=Pseudopedobacter sp. TaxID=1936787 RepID=UPI00333F16D5